MKKEFSIFIADNNEIDRLLLQSQLEQYCNNISLAADGKEALACLQQHQYDLIFLDIQMPFFSGLELIKIIKKTDGINNNSALFAITTQVEQQQTKMLINVGFEECLVKPILLPDLIEILNLWLAESVQKDSAYMLAILEKTAGNKELANTILNKLCVELPQQTDIIENALRVNDFQLAQQITHKLHGSASFCGFIQLQAAANKLENSLSVKNGPLSKQYFQDLKKHISDFLVSKTEI